MRTETTYVVLSPCCGIASRQLSEGEGTASYDKGCHDQAPNNSDWPAGDESQKESCRDSRPRIADLPSCQAQRSNGGYSQSYIEASSDDVYDFEDPGRSIGAKDVFVGKLFTLDVQGPRTGMLLVFDVCHNSRPGQRGLL